MSRHQLTDRLDAAMARIKVWVAWAAVGALGTAFWIIIWMLLGAMA